MDEMPKIVKPTIYDFDENYPDWEASVEYSLREATGTLHLIERDTGKQVDAKILFLYSILVYTGYEASGIVKIGDNLGSIGIDFKCTIKDVWYYENSNFFDKEFFASRVKGIIEDQDDDCRNSEAVRVQHYRGIGGMKLLVNQFHAFQIRNNNPDIAYAEHVYGVASVLESAANITGEIDKNTLNTMLCAALRHDLLEDTAADEWLLKYVDYKAYELIRELTNPNDDEHTDEYMERLEKASEEARIVKYADLIENTSSFCYSLHEPHMEKPIQRASEFYLPILERTTKVLEKTAFEKYPKTAEEMRKILKVYTELLTSRIEYLCRG